MSDSSGTNSWTVVTPEETAAETLRAEQHEGSNTSTAERSGCPSSVEGSVTTSELPVDERQGLEDQTDLGDNPSPDSILTPSPELEHPSPSTEDPSPSTEDTSPITEDPSTEDPSPSTEDSTPINEDPTPITENPTDDPTPLTVSDDLHPPSSLRVSGPSSSSFDDDAAQHSQSEGLPEGRVPPSPEADTFSDSYTHISPSPEEPPASMLTPETLGGEGLMQAGGGATEGEGLGQEAEESELSPRVTDSGKQADSPMDSEGWEEKVGEEEKEEGDTGLRRRRTLLEQIGRSDEDEEEEEEEEEEFQPPHRGEEFSFSLNKCILGAIILLGIGTVFFSGIFIDVDDESEYEAYMDLRDAEIPVKQEWSNTEGPPSLADDADLLNKLDKGTEQISDLQAQLQEWSNTEGPPSLADDADLLNKLDKGTEQISDLQAQLQAQQEELKVPQGQATEGAMKERLQRQAAVEEEENVADEAPPLPDTGGAAETPTGHTGDGGQEAHDKKAEKAEKRHKDKKKDKYDTGDKEWKDREKRERKEREKAEKKRKEDGGKKEWKEKEKRKYEREEGGKEGKDWKHKEEKKKKKEWKEKEEWKKGDGEGKQWKGREGRKEQEERKTDERKKEQGERKVWKKDKQEKWSDGERGKEEWKDKKRDKEERGWKKGKEESGKKEEKKHWKIHRNDRDEEGEWKEKDDKKHGGGKREWKKEEGKKEEWRKNGGRSDKDKHDKRHRDDRHDHRDGQRDHRHHDDHHHGHRDDKVWHAGKGGPSRSPPPSVEHPDYWLHQKHKLQRNASPPQLRCDSVETCARAQGLLQPVHHDHFQAILQGYLAKAEAAGAVEASVTEELRKLASDFFPDGVFAHHLMSFRDFTEDVADILEDMVEEEEEEGEGEEEEEEEEEDSALEQEMEGFEDEVMRKFGVVATEEGGGKSMRGGGERRKERGRG